MNTMLHVLPLRPALIACSTLIGLAGGAAQGQTSQNYLQWFETEWDDIERRVPDFFLAGYDAVWLPPVSVSSFHSPGYDPFNRFDLGQPPLLSFSSSRARTSYGTEATFKAMVDELHIANGEVYIDAIFNHNGGRTESDAFLAQGGYPGFWIPREDPPRDKQPTDDWGDFHNGVASGYLQSEDPGGARYDLHDGDLVALVDIAQESNNTFIRQPVEEGNPLNIPAGTIWNKPDPNNARFYPDQVLSPTIVSNPGTSRNPGATSFTRYPYNTSNPMAGDPVADNGTGMLMRWAQWMVEVQGVDGFRLDAHKHVPSWFWDGFFDSAVHKTRTSPATGNKVNPFSFGENVTGNFDILNNQIRKDSFANRDALDLQGAARLRDLLNAGGFGSWANINASADSGHLDFADDGLINGSMGVNHVFSHDNGTVGTGSSMPPLPTARQQGYPMLAYTLMRPGRAIVYHNGRQIPRTGGFYPREGNPSALGWDPATQTIDETITTLMHLRNQVGYGQYFQLNSNISDVLVYERAFNNQANCLVAVNDRFDSGTLNVTVSTSYPQGTRLHEMTGNAADPVIDPSDAIPETIVVGAGGSVTLTVPNNTTNSSEHGKGYLIYAESLPQAEVTFIGADGAIDPDPASFPDFIQRLSTATVITDDSFEIRLETTAGDPLDPNTDDNALFAFDQRNKDYNGNGSPDIPTTSSVIGGYEEFTTLKSPLYDSGNSFGLYRQEIDATQMSEGFHYLSVIAFRHRPSGTTPIFRDVRKVVYIDREPPAIELEQAGLVTDDDRPEFVVNALDRTTRSVYMFLNLDAGEDPLSMLTTLNQATPYDRFTYTKSFDSVLQPGANTVTIVAVEDSGNTNILTETVTLGSACPADFTNDGMLNFFDVSAFLSAFSAQASSADLNGDGQYNFFDVSAFLSAFSAGCP
ncbi:MAG: GC-type dockerin domain-anchored protein [Phycisphaerales bacterium JB047]